MDRPTTPTPDRNLRLINLVALPLSLPFIVPYGVVSAQVCPALGLVPLFISGMLSLLVLYNKANGPRIRPVRIFVDVFCACFLISILIPGWVILASDGGRWYGSVGANVTMCGTYGTVPMMAAFLIHTYVGLRDLLLWLRRPHEVPLCPHCHGDLSRPSYVSVHSHDGDEEAQIHQETGIATPSTTKKETLEIKDPRPESSDMPRESGEYRDSCEDETAPLL